MSENKLSELPEGMENLESLTELHMSGNSLSAFNVKIGRMTKLQKLSLDWFTFLIPCLPVCATRMSNFDIEREMHHQMQVSRANNNLTSIQSTIT